LAEFAARLETAFTIAEADASALVTLGVVPTTPHTGYGYLHRGEALEGYPGAYRVAEFAEKPALEVAQQYLSSGEYWWNAGMFVWRAETLLEQLRLLLPATHAAVRDLAAHPERLGEIFPTLFKTSVDYAVMEPVSTGQGSAHVVAVALDITWRDIGGYASLAEILTPDGAGNATAGRTVTLDAGDNVVFNADPDAVVALLGVRDLVVVRTPAATLVANAADAERIKQLVAEVAEVAGPDFA
ncbi:MAG: mannose-1-phosphate guanylyltransferase, partial [Propionibacteriales bacterium]|nr:mannose-1-phosphate guanylyltransferase [Propionibacteriales bacterium]